MIFIRLDFIKTHKISNSLPYSTSIYKGEKDVLPKPLLQILPTYAFEIITYLHEVLI
jgi:hypothetical protein